jgi:mevalonate kinase
MSHAAAPGKIILFGEHAVVYGRPAIAAPVIQVTAVATIEATAPGTGLIITAPDTGHTIQFTNGPGDNPLATAARLTLAHLHRVQPPDARLTVSATIPLGRGLGSGAAISTAIVRVIADFLGKPLPPGDVSTLVYEVEKFYHGTPSGIDNTVIAYEQPVIFVKGRPIQRLAVARSFTLVIADTGIIAPTREVVGDLALRRQSDPARYDGYFDEVAALATQAKILIQEGIAPPTALGKLMNENQELLEKMGVSSPELDNLILTARQAGALGAKLSGAGRGGNMIALVEPTQASTVAEALRQAGAVSTITTTIQ